MLKKHGIKKGDRVAIYMPMIPELAIAMLACARIGAIHSVVFGGFSPNSLRDRIQDSQCKMLITADEGVRGGRLVPLKANADEALLECPSIETVIVVSRTQNRSTWSPAATSGTTRRSAPPTSATTATSSGWTPRTRCSSCTRPARPASRRACCTPPAATCVYTTMTFKYVFDYHDDDVFFCTADIGWVTGHSYIVYGPLCYGGTSVMFEGVPNYPDAGRFWEMVDKHGINIFYTAPTAIRALMKAGDEWPAKYDLSSLRVLGTVGEPINPEAWMWYYKHIGREPLPHRRHLVADGDRRHADRQPARRHAHEAGLREPAALRHPAADPQRGRHRDAGQPRRPPVHHVPVARHAARHLGRPGAQARQGGLLLDLPRQVLHR